jgi:DNA mismatch endonuclease (patch repair protein)
MTSVEADWATACAWMSAGASIPSPCLSASYHCDVVMGVTLKKAPRYDGCQPATASASKAKCRNPPEDTRAELLLRRTLWAEGLHYRLHAKDLPGIPDVVFRPQRLAIFVDGDFWHGRDWEKRRKKLSRGSNADYWLAKIAYNIERDKKNTALLESMGWTLMRFWETDVLDNPENAVRATIEALARLRS